MSEHESETRVTWLEDPPETWAAAPDSPPETGESSGMTVSRAGGLLLRESGSFCRFLFTSDPVEVEQ